MRRAVYDAATAFTNVRRLQLVRWLVDNGPASAGVLAEKLGMSGSAVSRHADKLMRRGYLVSTRSGHRMVHAVAEEFATPVHARLFDIVKSTWEDGTLHSRTGVQC